MSITLKAGLCLLGLCGVFSMALIPNLGPCLSTTGTWLLFLAAGTFFFGSIATVIGLIQLGHRRLKAPRPARVELHL